MVKMKMMIPNDKLLSDLGKIFKELVPSMLICGSPKRRPLIYLHS